MKLKTLLEETTRRMKEKRQEIKEYATQLKASGNYNNFETKLAHVSLDFVYSSYEIVEWYEKYECNDEHITTLGKKALKNIGII